MAPLAPTDPLPVRRGPGRGMTRAVGPGEHEARGAVGDVRATLGGVS